MVGKYEVYIMMKMIFDVPLSELTAGSNNVMWQGLCMLPAEANHRLECVMPRDIDRLNYLPLKF